jgi:hypothetical protein
VKLRKTSLFLFSGSEIYVSGITEHPGEGIYGKIHIINNFPESLLFADSQVNIPKLERELQRAASFK